MKNIIFVLICFTGLWVHAFPAQLLKDNSGVLEWRNNTDACGVIYSPEEYELGDYLVEYYENGEIFFEDSQFELGDQVPRHKKSEGSHKFDLNIGAGYQVDILPQNDSYTKVNVRVLKARFWSGQELILSCEGATLVAQ